MQDFGTTTGLALCKAADWLSPHSGLCADASKTTLMGWSVLGFLAVMLGMAAVRRISA